MIGYTLTKHSHNTKTHNTNKDAHEVEERCARVASSLCCCGTRSFYDAAGRIDGA